MLKRIYKRGIAIAINWRFLVIILAALVLGFLFLAMIWRLKRGIAP